MGLVDRRRGRVAGGVGRGAGVEQGVRVARDGEGRGGAQEGT